MKGSAWTRTCLIFTIVTGFTAQCLGLHREHRAGRSEPPAEDLYSLGEAYIDFFGEEFDPGKALEALQAAICLRPDYAEAYRGLGRAYHLLPRNVDDSAAIEESGDEDSSVKPRIRLKNEIDAYERGILLKPNYADAYVDLGKTYFTALLFRDISTLSTAEREAAGNAEQLYLKALSVDPNCTNARYELASLYYIQGKYSDGLAQFWEALVIDPGFPSKHRLLLNEIANRKHFDDVVGIYEEAIRRCERLPGTFVALAELYFSAANYEAAAEAFRQAIRVDTSDSAYSHERLADTYLAMGNKEAAYDEGLYLKLLAERQPDFLERHFGLQRADGYSVSG